MRFLKYFIFDDWFLYWILKYIQEDLRLLGNFEYGKSVNKFYNSSLCVTTPL